jgi:glycerol kinase
MRGRFLLAIDAGTSSTRTVVYDHQARVVASAQREFAQRADKVLGYFLT